MWQWYMHLDGVLRPSSLAAAAWFTTFQRSTSPNRTGAMRPIWKTRSVWGRQAVIQDPGGPSIALREWRAPDGPYVTGWYPEPE
jgi:hypothetical protein